MSHHEHENKSFVSGLIDFASSKPFVALAFAGIGFVIGVLSGVAF